ncbi:MAG: M6 family metalloprotease domain-containing protein [Chthoniobacteraceae bacterium]
MFLRIFATAITATTFSLTTIFAADTPPDLKDFRTVSSAKTTAIIKTSVTAGGRPGYLGIELANGDTTAPVVAAIEPGSPAQTAGIQPGDTVSKVAETDVQNGRAFREAIQSLGEGATATIHLTRAGKPLDLTVQLASASRPKVLPERQPILGLRLADRTDGDGLLAGTIPANSPQARAGIKSSDAILKIDGSPIRTSFDISIAIADHKPGDKVKLTLLRDGKEIELDYPLLAAADNDLSVGPARNIWKKDTFNLGIICVEFPDVPHNAKITTESWSESIFSKGTYHDKRSATGQPVFGSFNDYYGAISCGAFHAEGKAFDWVKVAKKRGDYNQGTNPAMKAVLLNEAMDLILARDGKDALDGYDGFFFLYAGERFPTTNRGSLYWPHRSTFLRKIAGQDENKPPAKVAEKDPANAVSESGKSSAAANKDSKPKEARISYFICPEGGKTMTGISVFCHEFGHMLGLPDLYARPENPGSEGAGVWCLMANELGKGRPQHMSAWSKEKLGWLKPAVIDPTEKQKLILAPVEGSATECFKVLIRRDASEYLLLENRQQRDFDTGLPAAGLLIWRVVGDHPILEESHGIEGPLGPRVFLNAVPFPSASGHAFTPDTHPSSRSLLGGGLPVHVNEIRQLPDGRITFTIGHSYQ